MRILFLNTEAELQDNGGDKMLLLTVDTLAQDHEVSVLLPEPGPLVDAIRDLGVRCDVIRYAVLHRRAANPLRAVGYLLHLAVSAVRLGRYVRKHDIDVVYANSLGVLEGCVLRLLGGPTHIWHIHDMIDGARAVNRVFAWLVGRGADVGICVSEAARDHLPVRSGNLRVVWNGIPPIVPEPEFMRTGQSATIGVVGRFNRLKGHGDMVKAAAVLRSDGAEFKVRLVGGSYRGDDTVRQQVRRLASDVGLESGVTVEDSVTDVASVYRGLDLVAVPSVLLDSFPTVALEAMSAGKPVVGYAGGGLPEMLGFDADCLAPVGDSQALATQIRRFLEDEDFRQAKARLQHARYLEHFALQQYRERLRDALRDVLDAGHAASPSEHEGLSR